MSNFACYALGQQWFVGTATVTATAMAGVLWECNFPAVLHIADWKGGGIEAVWTCFIPSMIVIDSILMHKVVLVDWDAFGEEVQDRNRLPRLCFCSSKPMQERMRQHR